MRRVLVTGGAGFIAHHLIAYLLDHDSELEVVALDRLDYSGDLNRLDYLVGRRADRERVRVVFHDLKAAINPTVARAIGDVDTILHLAAGSHVDRSIADPMSFVLDNVVGTCNILEFARDLQDCDELGRFLYFSTDEVFGPAPGDIRYREHDRYNATNPYSASKAGAEELVVAYENTYGLPCCITHTMNVFGERQHPEKFIPSTIRKVLHGESVTVHADRSRQKPGSRFYIHALDVASAVCFVLDRLDSTDPADWVAYGGAKCPKFNIVGADEIDNLTLAKTIAEVVGKPLEYELVDFHSSRPGHDLRYALDGSLMRELGWRPTSTLNRLAETVRWSLQNPEWLEV